VKILERGGQRHAGGVGAAAAEGGQVAVLVHALEAGHHHHASGLEVFADAVVVDMTDARLGVRAVGEDAHLAAGVGTGRLAARLQRDAQQRDGDLLAGGEQHVHLARRRAPGNFLGHFQQPVGFTGHGRDHHDHVVALLAVPDHLVGDVLDALQAANRSAAVFLD
jgi:hypothetical protein